MGQGGKPLTIAVTTASANSTRVVQLLKTFRRLLYGGDTELRVYERLCLDCWRRILSDEAKTVLDQQLRLFNLIQRLSEDKLVVFHDVGSDPYRNWPESALFAFRGEEALAATVLLKPSLQATLIRVDVMLHRGRLSSLEFSAPPKERLRSSGIEILKIDEWIDPMRADTRQDTPEADELPMLTGEMKEWIERNSVSDLRKPLTKSEIDLYLQRFDIVVPEDYVELISQTNGLRSGNCIVLGPSRIRKIVLPERTLCVLVEIEKRGVIGVEQQNQSGDLLFFSNEDEIRPVGSSLLTALEQECIPEHG
jgi:hypothetical protein